LAEEQKKKREKLDNKRIKGKKRPKQEKKEDKKQDN
jgi:hypothetical protein